MDTDALSAVPVCNCHRRRNSLPGPGKHNTVHFSAPGHIGGTPDESGAQAAGPEQLDTNAANDEGAPAPSQMPPDIPVQYIVDQLHRLGPFYWHKPETTDCTIQVPIDQRRLSRAPNFDFPGGLNTGVLNANLDVRRGSAPVSSQTNPTPRSFTTLKLHQFYLTSQSSLLRALFSGSSAIGLVSAQSSSAAGHRTINVQGIGRRDSTPSLARIPRLLPSSAHHPTLYLPLPDPASFPHIVHYLYFGSPAFIEEALSLGRIRWDGVVRNVEYLGLFEEEAGTGIRRWLMQWRERQRRASLAAMGYHTSHHVSRGSGAVQSGASFDPILIEESSEGSTTSDSKSDSDSDEYMDEDEDYEGTSGSDEHWSEDWDPMVMAIAGMKMADPFALDPQGYAQQRQNAARPVHMESVDPLHG